MTDSTITTVALLERKPTISRSLFSRYWRDVHGVMAARIPGFDTYTQHHVTPLYDIAEPFEGIAIVTFKTAADRAGLINSDVTQHIHRDEQNVFRRAMLFNLDQGDHKVVLGSPDAVGQSLFVVMLAGEDAAATLQVLARTAVFLATYDLTRGNPSGWNNTDTAGSSFVTLIHGIWPDAASARLAAQGFSCAYLSDERHVMVEDGLPTPVGLRGLSAVETIMEAGADNQLGADVVRAIYGPLSGR
jgi:hypothetical protein